MRSGEGLRPAQARAATYPDSVAVVAGAGTGKTHMLSHRFLFHLEQGLDPLQIVAVTFTERAAAELRARIRALVARALPDRPEVPVALEAAQISTLHALAARVCRDHPEEAGVPPDFTVLDELEGQLWLAERLDEALAELPAEVFAELSYGDVRDALARMLGDPVEAQAALERPVDGWQHSVASARREALDELTGDPAWRDAAKVVRAARGEEGDKAEIARAFAATALDLLERGEVEAALEALDRVNLSGGRRAAWPEGDLPAVKDALRLLRENARAAAREGALTLALGPADDRLAALLPHVRSAFEAVRGALAGQKRRRRVLDFADLEVHALRALERPEVRAHCAARWRAVLVDEFQDTNRVQERLLDLLTGGMTVSVVGDEKQSIYGFRGADVEVFRRHRARLRAPASAGEPAGEPAGSAGPEGPEVAMSASFRAHGPLTRTLNRIFTPVLADLHQDLTAVRDEAPDAGPYVTAHLIEGKGGKARLQVSEARRIATVVKGMLDAGVPVWDKDSGSNRPLRPEDVAVLTRTWQPLGVYGEILPALGVPAVHSGGGNLLDTREAKDAMALLRFLADPRDDVALAALLRGPFFAVADPVLYRFARSIPEVPEAVDAGPTGGPQPGSRGADGGAPGRAADDAGARVSGLGTGGLGTGGRRTGGRRTGGRRAPWWHVLEGARDLPAELVGPRATLADLLAARAWTPSRRLQLADALTGYTAVLSGLPGAERRLADWTGFLEFTRTLEAGLGDVFSVVRRLRRLLRAEVDVPRPVVQAEGAVNLLTVHRSKGLEWPVVVVADLGRGSTNRGPRMLFRRELGVAFRLQDEDGGAVDPALYTLLRRDRRRRDEDEEKRVLYVALTRARDRLVLTSAATSGGGLDVLAPGLEAAGVVPEVVEHDPDLAAYPPPPAPQPAATVPPMIVLDEGTLGRHARHVEPRTPSAEAEPPEQDPWSRTLSFLPSIDDVWVGVAEALRDAGVPPPEPGQVGVALTRGGVPGDHVGVLVWDLPGGRLAVVDPATPEATYDAELLRLDPTDPPTALARRVLAALERSS